MNSCYSFFVMNRQMPQRTKLVRAARFARANAPISPTTKANADY